VSGPYPGYDVLAKWPTPSFDDTTRAVLARRLAPPPAPRFFRGEAFRLLQAVVDRLLPQEDRAAPIPVAAWIDARLADGRGEGYRNEHMPPQAEAWRLGLAGLDAEARRRFGRGFADLPAGDQDATLRGVQAGEVEPAVWGGMDAARFFRDGLLKTAAGLYYAHPTAWSEIGFGGPASPRGYVRLGFGERDPWEAEAAR
jgi:hypothetical protein